MTSMQLDIINVGRWSTSAWNSIVNLILFGAFMKFVLIVGIIVIDPPLMVKVALLGGVLGSIVLATIATMIIRSRPGYRLSTAGIIAAYLAAIIVVGGVFDFFKEMVL